MRFRDIQVGETYEVRWVIPAIKSCPSQHRGVKTSRTMPRTSMVKSVKVIEKTEDGKVVVLWPSRQALNHNPTGTLEEAHRFNRDFLDGKIKYTDCLVKKIVKPLDVLCLTPEKDA